LQSAVKLVETRIDNIKAAPPKDVPQLPSAGSAASDLAAGSSAQAAAQSDDLKAVSTSASGGMHATVMWIWLSYAAYPATASQSGP